MKSEIDIKDDIFFWLKSSQLNSSVTGKLCKSGKRPKDSTGEDIVINVIANNIAQKQSAIVNVNVYVKDDERDGQFEEATIRVRELCALCFKAMERGFSNGWVFTMESQMVFEQEAIGWHVINNRLYYKIINE